MTTFISKTFLLFALFLLFFVSRSTAEYCEHLLAAESCYIFVEAAETWTEAEYECSKTHGGDLTSLESEEEITAIRQKVQHEKGHQIYYVGGSSTGNKGSKSDKTQDKCPGLDFTDGHKGGMAEFDCTEKHAYICKVPTLEYGHLYDIGLDKRPNYIPTDLIGDPQVHEFLFKALEKRGRKRASRQK